MKIEKMKIEKMKKEKIIKKQNRNKTMYHLAITGTLCPHRPLQPKDSHRQDIQLRYLQN
jgi:hypothetical protein